MEGITAESIRWKETSPGIFTRHLDRREMFLKSLSMLANSIDKTNDVVCSYVEYASSNANIVEAFQEAWVWYRVLHPHIADELQGTTRIFNSNLDPKQTAAESFFVHHDQTLAQVFTDIKNGDKAAMHVFPKEKKVFVLRGHETCDGRGHLLIWDEFLSIAQAIIEGRWTPPSTADVASRLAPAFDSITDIPITGESMKGAGEQIGWMVSNEHCLPSHNLDQKPGTNVIRGLQFSEQETSSALRAIKARGVTVTPAVQAAVSTTSNKIAGTPGMPHSALLSVDVRRYTGKDAKQPLTNYFAGIVRLWETGTYDETLANCVKGYSSVHASVLDGSASAITDILYPAMLNVMHECPPHGQRTYVDLSSPGIMEDFVQYKYGESIEVKDIRVFQRDLFAQIWLFFTTWRGKFEFTMTFNEMYHTREEMDRWLVTFREELLNGLGVKQDLEGDPLGPF